MISIDNVAKQFGDQVLFRNAGFAVGPGERIGVVGPNGAGKTTFFRMLAGELLPDEGEIRTPKNYRVAQLRQEWLPRQGDTVLEAALREFAPWFEAREAMNRIEGQLSESPNEKLVERYLEIEHQFSILGGHQVEQTARELLAGLGFGSGQFGQPAVQLSGGWRIRCHLAGLLLQEADLLLLDEPTNHLDIRSVKWFEEFLEQYRHSFMLISHDRRLVQRLARSILEFAPPQLTLWPGSLRQYETLKQQRIDQLEATIANKQKEVERLEDFARRFRAKATKARQAQNRLKTADHYQQQIEELRESMPVVSRRPASFRLELERRLPSRVLEFEKAVFGYGAGHPLFELPQCLIEGGRKIGIVGVNGAGKSTFLKCCAGELPLLSGSLRSSDQVSTGFFAQHRMEELPLQIVTLDYLEEQSFGNPPPGCALSRPASGSQAAISRSGSKCCRAARRPASAWRASCCPGRACCCSTNRPTTSISKLATPSRTGWLPTRGPCWWFRTTATSSTLSSTAFSRSNRAKRCSTMATTASGSSASKPGSRVGLRSPSGRRRPRGRGGRRRRGNGARRSSGSSARTARRRSAGRCRPRRRG